MEHRNFANTIVYGALEISYILNSASKFAMSDGQFSTGHVLTQAAGAFGAVSALSGFYLLYEGLCETIFPVPLGELRYFRPRITTTKNHTRA